MLDTLLDLVEVSLDARSQRDVRRRRTLDELQGGRSERAAIVQDMITARLLSISTEMRDDSMVEVVDIIHESLIANWERLRATVVQQRDRLQQRTRFEQVLQEWLDQERSDDYLLNGVRLAEAEVLDNESDIALRDDDAQEFLLRSIARREEAHLHELENLRELERQQRLRFEAEQQRAAEQALAARKLRSRMVLVIGVLVLALVAAASATLAFRRALQREHEAEMQALASEANLQLASGSPDDALALLLASFDNHFDVPNGEAILSLAAYEAPRKQITGHPTEVMNLDISTDGRILFSNSWDGTLILWDATTGQQLHHLQGHQGQVQDIALAPDGTVAYSAGQDQTLRVWDVKSGNELRHINLGRDILTLSLSHDGNTFLIQLPDQIWLKMDAFTGRKRAIRVPPGDPFVNGIFYPDDTRILFGTENGNLIVIDGESGKEVQRFEGLGDSIYPFSFNHEGTQVLYTSDGLTFRLFDLENDEVQSVFSGHIASVQSAYFSPDGHTVFSCAQDGTVRLWDPIDGREMNRIKSDPISVNDMVVAPNGTSFWTANQDQTIRWWDTASGAELSRMNTLNQEVNDIAMAPGGTLFALSADADVDADTTSKIVALERTTGTHIRSYPSDDRSCYSLALAPDGSMLAYEYESNGTVVLVDTASGSIVRRLRHPDSAIYRIVFSSDSRFLLTSTDTSLIRLWDTASGELLAELRSEEEPARGLALSPDGTQALIGSLDGTINLWDIANDTQTLFYGHTDNVPVLVLSPDGKTAYSGSEDMTIREWDLEAQEEVGLFRGHEGRINDLALSHNGRWLLSAASDTTIRLWDTESGQELRRYQGHFNEVSSLAFSPDEQTFVSGSFDHTIRQWRIDATFEDLQRWVAANRDVPELDCDLRDEYGLQPLCPVEE